jgi:hypothetical protein
MLIRTTFHIFYHRERVYCDYFDQDHVLIVIWLDYLWYYKKLSTASSATMIGVPSCWQFLYGSIILPIYCLENWLRYTLNWLKANDWLLKIRTLYMYIHRIHTSAFVVCCHLLYFVLYCCSGYTNLWRNGTKKFKLCNFYVLAFCGQSIMTDHVFQNINIANKEEGDWKNKFKVTGHLLRLPG